MLAWRYDSWTGTQALRLVIELCLDDFLPVYMIC
jgi:hypothetical protein